MKRGVFGLVLLILLFGVGLAAEKMMVAIHVPASSLLETSARCAMEEDWPNAAESALRAKTRWEKYWNFSASLADHGPMEEIDGLFAQLTVFLGEKETADFAATGQELSRRLKAMAQAHTFRWWNVM